MNKSKSIVRKPWTAIFFNAKLFLRYIYEGDCKYELYYRENISEFIKE